MKILITGASGFVGSHLVDEAYKRGYEVYAGVRKTSSRKYLQHDGLHFFESDFSKQDSFAKNLEDFGRNHGGFDWIVHNAGITQPKRTEEFHQGNAIYSEFFAKTALTTQPKLKKFVYMSSLASIGPGHDKFAPALNENKTPEPITPYGKSKLAAEQLLHAINDLPYIFLRPTGIFGPRDFKFAKLVKPIAKGWNVRIADRDQRISLIYISDLSRAVLDLCEMKGSRLSFNISDGKCYNPVLFGQEIARALNVKVKNIRVPKAILYPVSYIMWLAARIQKKNIHLSPSKLRELSSPNCEIDIQALRDAIGFMPEYDLKSGLEEYIAWYKDNVTS